MVALFDGALLGLLSLLVRLLLGGCKPFLDALVDICVPLTLCSSSGAVDLVPLGVMLAHEIHNHGGDG